jgi:magnesium transporter
VETNIVREMSRVPTAAGLVQEVVTLGPLARVSDALASLKSAKSPAQYIALCEKGKLLGLITVSALLLAESQSPLRELIQRPQAIVAASTSSEHTAFQAAHAGADVVAAVDGDNRFLGVIPASRLLALMVHEHEIDLARLGGFFAGTRRATTAGEEAIPRRLWHRLPWLILGLAGAVLTANVVGSFEGILETQIALAFFLPGVVYLADAVGTQTETVVVRGFSVGVSMPKVARGEVLTGLFAGLVLALLFLPAGLLLTAEVSVALTVTLALFAACLIATIIGVSLPWLLQRFDWDPAFGTGPLSTVLQDFFSIVVYFAIASIVVG